MTLIDGISLLQEMDNKTFVVRARNPQDLVGGAPQIELYLLQTVMILCMLFRNLSFPLIFSGKRFIGSAKLFWLKFLLDYMFVVAPGVLSMTVLGYSLDLFAIVLIICNLLLLIIALIQFLASKQTLHLQEVLNCHIDETFHPTSFLTVFRGSMLVQIGVAILAVDFQVFPNKFAKTIHYGHSVMDIGVAACIIADGLASKLKRFRKKREPKTRTSWSFLLSSRVILPALGFLRIFFLWAFSYGHSSLEYGVHWNFFFTLAVIDIVARLIPSSYPIWMSIIFGILHVFLLADGREMWILVGNNPRDNLILANIEGISSLTGYICMYYAAAAVGSLISKTTDDLKSWMWRTVHIWIIAFAFYVAQIGTEQLGYLPSRRVCNITFVFSQLSLLIYAVAILLLFQMIVWFLWVAGFPRFSNYDGPYEAVRPDLQDTINHNGLLFFLGSNILTGLVNISMNTIGVDDEVAMLILFAYMGLMSLIVNILRYRAQKKEILL